jgi:alpha-galactosidase
MMKKNTVNNFLNLGIMLSRPKKETDFCRNSIHSNTYKVVLRTLFCAVFGFFFINTVHAQSVTYQAENGSLFNGAKIQNCGACSEGKQVGDIGGSAKGFFTNTVNVPTAGNYTMNLSFSSGDPRSIFISVNSGSPIEVVCNSGNWGVVASKNVSIALNAGNNSIRFFNDNGFGPNIDKFDLTPEQAVAPCPGCLTVEAETMSLLNGAVIQNCTSCSGGRQVGNIGGTLKGAISTTVNIQNAGNYTLDFSFSSGDPRTIFISINNGTPRQILCNSGNWSVVAIESIQVTLNVGSNTIRFFNDNGFGPNIDKFELKPEQSTANSFNFGKTGKLNYNPNTGTVNVNVNNRQIITDGYAEFTIGTRLISTKDYTSRVVTKSAVTDGFGTGEKIVITHTGTNLPLLEQIFYVYPNRENFLTEIQAQGTSIETNYMAPLISADVKIFTSGDNRMLFVPFDNDTFIRYNSREAQNNATTTSSEVGAFYENNSRNGLIVGSIEHGTWKTGVKTSGSGSSLTELKVWGGYTSVDITRDNIAHGKISGNTLKSPKIFVGLYEDWREGMEEYGKANAIAEPRYVFDWTKPTPMVWNSWGVIQKNLSLENAKGVTDFVANELPIFRSGDTAFINLDSYWDNLVTGGLAGDFSKLTEFVKYCKSKGLTPGIYWAPWIDFGKFDRKVEGSSFNYINAWTKVNGGYHDLNDGRALDPTHPATKDRINLVIDKFKANGFEMIKIDFIGHAAVEGDKFFDPQVKTGMQAFHHGMKYLLDRLDNKMLVYVAISPNLATGPYAHMRRIATDAFANIEDTQYTLNSTTYGWWQNQIYDYIDADHMVFRNVSLGENRARLVSGIVTGTLTIGDDFSTPGPWNTVAKQLLQNKELLQVAADGTAFRPIETRSFQGASEVFVKKMGTSYFVGVLNYAAEKTFNISLQRLGIVNGNHCVKELFSGRQYSLSGNALQATIGPEDAQFFEIITESSNCVFSLASDNYKIQSTNVSCPGNNNGKITLNVGDRSLNYTVSITGLANFSLPNAAGSYEYSTPNLAPGVYDICFKVNGIPNYQECYQITIVEPAIVDVSTIVNKVAGTVTLKLKGSDSYTLTLNGVESRVDSNEHTIALQSGLNTISVKGKQDCQGVFSKQIYLSDSLTVYPNPATNFVRVDTPQMGDEVQVKLFSVDGALLMNFMQNTKESKSFEVDLATLKSGLYILSIGDQKLEQSVKIIKK